MAAAAKALDSRRATDIMMQPLRRAHLWIWIVLAMALPVLYAVSLIARRPVVPVNPALHWEEYR